MTPVNLLEPAKAYVKAAMAYLAERIPESPPQTIIGLRDWVRSGNVLMRQDRTHPFCIPAIWAQIKNVHALAEFQIYAKALATDEFAAHHIGMVRTPSGGRAVQLDYLVDLLLWGAIEGANGFRFDESTFEKLFAEFQADLQRETFEYVAVGPIPGLRADVESVLLEPDFELTKLTDDELIRCLGVSVYPNQHHFNDTVLADGNYGLRFRFSLRKFFGTVPTDELEKFYASNAKMLAKYEEAIHALRLFKRGTVSIPGLAVFSNQWPMTGSTVSYAIEPGSDRGGNYELQGPEVRILARSEDCPRYNFSRCRNPAFRIRRRASPAGGPCR